MSTLKQLEANRLNSQKSTGPRSVQGKAASSMNALKTGIHAQSLVIRGENPDDLAALTAEYYDHWQPTAPEERLWLDTLIRNDWLLRRLFVAEAQLWEYGFQKAWGLSQTAPLGHVSITREDSFRHLQRRINDTQRNCARALDQLQRLQKERREAPSPAPARPPIPLHRNPQPLPKESAPQKLASFRNPAPVPRGAARPHPISA